ncbi:MAG: four helix bundle protein [Phycisphaerae bacterium]|nr:four helix bundle protein [Phycisphaerae bacterium]
METKKLKSFKELIVWQKAYILVLEIYKLTCDFPKSETYGLTQQVRRAAISIPSNIAEGYGRKHKTDYHRFLSIAYGSLLELETQYLLAVDLGYTKQNNAIKGLLKEVGGMLYRIMYPKPDIEASKTIPLNPIP